MIDWIHKLPGCSHQLLSHSSQNRGYSLILHPWQIFRAPHSTWSEIGILLREVGTMCLSGDPGCGQRSQESPLYNLTRNLVLQLGDPQVRRAGTTNTLFCIQALDCLFYLYS